jgi:putative peptidoglycan lipid II flippase
MASTVINVTLLVMTLAGVAAAIFAPQLVPLIAPGFDAEARILTASLMRIMLIQAVVVGLSGLVAAILNSYQDFLLPALSPVIYNATIIAAGLVLAPRPEFGVRGLAIGVAIGSVLHLLIQIPGLVRHRAHYRLIIDAHNPGARETGRLMVPRIAGLGAIQVNYLANTILASRLVEGSIASLNYAFQLLMLPWGIFANAISTAVFPTLSAQAALDQPQEIRRLLSSALRVILYLTIPAGIGLLVLREPIIHLLFQRGEFTAESTAMTARALAFYAPGLFAIAATEIITRGFYALHDTRTPVTVGVAMVALNILLSIILSGGMGHGGLALAYSIAMSLEMVILLVIIHRRLGGLDDQRLVTSVLRTVVASAIMGEGLAMGVFAAGDLLLTSPALLRLLLLTVLVLAGMVIYLCLSIWLGSEEITRLARR